MKILIISGFLGAGKTTFIKELIRRTRKNIVVMENEFGGAALDAGAVSGGGIEVLEFMEGCVCCTMKDSFVNSVLTVAATLDPEYLVIEPTGAAELGAVVSSLRKLCYGSISLAKPVAIVSPAGFAAGAGSAVYRDQIRSAAVVVLSKTENSDQAETELLCRGIRGINPDADIIAEHYTHMPDEWWDGLFGSEHAAAARVPVRPRAEQLEEYTVKGRGTRNIAELVELLRGLLWGYYGNVVRAKGEILCGGEPVRFDLAEGKYSVVGRDGGAGNALSGQQCVFIGTGLDRERLGGALCEQPAQI
mgnify:CR=1 FL=1